MRLLVSLIIGFTSVQALADGYFNFTYQGTTLYVYSNNKLIVKWADYKTHQVVGDVIGLVDTNGIFGAFGADGRTIVNNYTKTKEFWVRQSFVAVLDGDGVFDMYDAKTGKGLVRNWKDTVDVAVSRNMVALLDKNGIFDAYNSLGGTIVHNYRDSVSFGLGGNYVAILDKNGIFDVYRSDGAELVRNWKDAIKYLTFFRAVAVLDKNGVFNVYNTSDGSLKLDLTDVKDIRETHRGIEYYQSGQWRYYSP